MLIARDGSVIGTVSGGCLEADLLERAHEVFDTGRPIVVTYDTRTKDDSVFSLNMGCDGVLRILIEPVAGNDLIPLIQQVLSTRRPVTVATVIASDDPKRAVGERTIVNDSFARSHGSVECFVETIEPPLRLVVFGAGFDAVPVIRIAKELGWYVTVVDHRPAYLDPERLSHPDELVALPPEQLLGHLYVDAATAAVVMTHNFDHDREILAFLLGRDLRYIGALGPKKRTERIMEELTASGRVTRTDTNIHAPIGLDIGAQTPESIALSIVAEIQAVTAGRAGGFLRNREAPIYDRAKDPGAKEVIRSGSAHV